MRELMELLCDYLSLHERVSQGAVLTVAERARWLTLLKVLPGSGRAPSAPDDDEDENDGSPVELTDGAGFAGARLMAVSRDGLRLRIERPLTLGERTVVRVPVARGGEYAFPCVVAWRDDDSMGLRFDGLPVKGRAPAASEGPWGRGLGRRGAWGSRRGAGVA
ncbi:MAG: PilZ domain-containing protein [Polyangiales bacterium]